MEHTEKEITPTYSVIYFPSKDIPESYLPVVYSRWLKSHRFGSPLMKRIDANNYYKYWHEHIENLMAKDDAIMRFAVLSDDRDIVLGFSHCRGDILDYVHVAGDYRKLGIARDLVPYNIKAISHITETGYNIWQKKHKEWKFTPFQGK